MSEHIAEQPLSNRRDLRRVNPRRSVVEFERNAGRAIASLRATGWNEVLLKYTRIHDKTLECPDNDLSIHDYVRILLY